MSARSVPRSRQALADSVLSALLALLVAGSLVLTGRLWLTNPYLTPPPEQPQTYVAADADGRLAAADLVLPARLVVHADSGGARALRDPADAAFHALWSQARPILRLLTPKAVAAAKPSSPQAFASAATTGATLEMTFATRLPWTDWWDALTGGSAGGGPEVDRLLIVPGAAPPDAPTAPTVFLAAGTAVRSVVLPVGSARPLAKQLAALPETGDLLRALPAAVDGIDVLPGVLVTAGALPPPLRVGVERLDATALVDASFADPSVVRRAIEDDGSSFYTDGEDWLRIAPDGDVRWSAPQASGPATGGLAAAIQQAAAFVDGRGGWPPGATLVGTAPISPQGSPVVGAPPGGYELGFAPRYDGYLLLSGPAPVALSVGAAGVVSYVRRVVVPLGSGAPGAEIGPEEALADLARHWPTGSTRSPRLVTGAWEGYVYRGGGLAAPAWVFDLAGGQQVLVDALDGSVLGPLAVLP